MFAKDYRKLAWSKLSGNWGMAIIATLLCGVITGAAGSTGIGALIVTGPMTVGLCGIFLTILRSGKPQIENLFDGFTSCFVNSMIASILISIFTFLWSLLLFIPGIIASYSYAMTFYIQKDHPELTATEAIDASKKMMQGHKWQLFCLDFSFIGWWLLTGLTFGLLAIMVVPYQNAARAAFYENIKGEPTVIEGTATEA